CFSPDIAAGSAPLTITVDTAALRRHAVSGRQSRLGATGALIFRRPVHIMVFVYFFAESPTLGDPSRLGHAAALGADAPARVLGEALEEIGVVGAVRRLPHQRVNLVRVVADQD